MSESIFPHIFPRHPLFWVAWLLSIALVFPTYYLDDNYYGQIRQEQEQRKWFPCATGGICSESYDQDKNWLLRIKQPNYAADFKSTPIEIVVTNNSGRTENIVLTLKLDHSYQNVYENFYVDGKPQNFIYVEDVQKNGRISQTFDLEIIGGAEDQKYTLEVYVNNEQIDMGYINDSPIIFSRKEIFNMWAVEYLLSPPFSNIFIPIILLIIIYFSQIGYFFTQIINQIILDKPYKLAWLKWCLKLLIPAVFFISFVFVGYLIYRNNLAGLGADVSFFWQELPSNLKNLFTFIFWFVSFLGLGWGLVEIGYNVVLKLNEDPPCQVVEGENQVQPSPPN